MNPGIFFSFNNTKSDYFVSHRCSVGRLVRTAGSRPLRLPWSRLGLICNRIWYEGIIKENIKFYSVSASFKWDKKSSLYLIIFTISFLFKSYVAHAAVQESILEKDVLLRQVQCSTDEYEGQNQSFGQIGVLKGAANKTPILTSFWFASADSKNYSDGLKVKSLCHQLMNLKGRSINILIQDRQLLTVEANDLID